MKRNFSILKAVGSNSPIRKFVRRSACSIPSHILFPNIIRKNRPHEHKFHRKNRRIVELTVDAESLCKSLLSRCPPSTKIFSKPARDMGLQTGGQGGQNGHLFDFTQLLLDDRPSS